MANAKFNTKNIEIYKKNLERFVKDKDIIAETILTDIAVRFVGEIIRNTPVDEGTLRMGWLVNTEEEAEAQQSKALSISDEDIRTSTKIEKNGNNYICYVSNIVSYAQAVEYGHRITGRNGVTTGWKDGVFMMTLAEAAIIPVANQIAKDSFERIARTYGI